MPHSLSRRCPGETLVSSLSGGPFQGLGTGWRAFPLLNLPVHRPPRPRPAPPLLRAAPVRQEPLSPHRHHLPHRRGQADTFLRRRGTCLAAATRADLEAFLADPLARRPAPTTRSSRSSTAGWPRKSDPTNPILSADSSPRKGEHPGAREDLNLRPSASYAGALSPDLQGQGVVLINDDHLLDGRRRHYTADQIRAGCTPGTARPRLALRHASPLNYLSLERRRVGRSRPQPCRPAACAGL
jgi:hypothetical protein